MYISDFESFYTQAAELFRSRPLETRYCIKYRHCDGKLVLKVTDDRTVRGPFRRPSKERARLGGGGRKHARSLAGDGEAA